VHGGDLADIRAAFPDVRAPWLDLSTGINPWPYPVGRLAASAWRRLPAGADELTLRAAAAAHFGIATADDVVMAPGSQSIIQWLPTLRAPGRVAVVLPTYHEHAVSWLNAGHLVSSIRIGERLAPDIAVLVVTRPNNPDGSVAPLAWLAETADTLRNRGGLLVVDEAFADVDPAPSVFASLPRTNTLVLRSFGKFFGLAGGRLGFALTAGTNRDRLRAALGQWAVSGPMLAIGARAYRDNAWIARTRARLARGARRLDALAAPAGLKQVGGTALFRLYESDAAGEIFVALARAGIYVRRFAEQPHWLRIGLPPDAAAMRRLAKALRG
jgi:cobalamin biosynthesis protein CobC